MYPGYKNVRAVLDEYASTFFVLLAEGYRIRYKNYQMLTNIAMLPNAEDPETRTQFIEHLSVATTDPRDILNLDTDINDTSGIDLLRSIL